MNMHLWNRQGQGKEEAAEAAQNAFEAEYAPLTGEGEEL